MRLSALAMFLAAATLSAQSADAGTELLKTVDGYRLPETALAYTVVITTTEAGVETDREAYKIVSAGSKSLIEMQGAKTKGQVVLVLNRQMWIKMPKSKQVIRVTPLQRLTGNASFSDLSRLQFAQSYTVSATAPAENEGRAATSLQLKARTTDETFPTVTLIVDAKDASPLHADFFLPSGKKFKSISFLPPETLLGRRLSTRYSITDEISGLVSTLAVSQIQTAVLPDSTFSLSRLEGN